MKDKIMWVIGGFTKENLYGVFSTKGKAIDAIKLWMIGVHKYTIETDLSTIPRLDGKPATINIRYDENGRLVSFYIHKFALNNGAGLIHSYRHNFGDPDENKD
jgi:hypothetical protein